MKVVNVLLSEENFDVEVAYNPNHLLNSSHLWPAWFQKLLSRLLQRKF